MKKVTVFGRNITKDQKKVIKNMIKAAEIELDSIIDLASTEPATTPYTALALGKIAYNYITKQKLAEEIHLLPVASKLKKTEKNIESRKEAWNILTNIKAKKKNNNTPTEEGDWDYMILQMGDKNVCVFKQNKPKKVDADIFVSMDEVKLMLEVKKALNISEDSPVIPYKR